MRVSIGLIVVVTAVVFASEAKAELPVTCIDRLESKSGQLIATVSNELSRSHQRIENHHGAISKAWQDFAQYFQGAWVKECLDTHPEHKERYNNWLTANAQPVSDAAGKKMGELCSEYTTKLIADNKTKTERYIERGSTAEAVTWTRSFENYLKRSIVVGCKPVSKQVQEVAQNYIPSIRNRANLEGKSVTFVSRVFNIQHVLTEVKTALASKGAKLTEAPSMLEGGQGQSDFANSLKDCVAEAKALRGYGATDDYQLKTKQRERRGGVERNAKTAKAPTVMTLLDAESLCRKTQQGLESLIAKVTAHNETYRSQRAKAWEKRYIKGAAMRRVYTENSKRWPDVESLGSKTIWTYRSYTTGAVTHQCKEYTFSKSGQLKNRKTRLCN